MQSQHLVVEIYVNPLLLHATHLYLCNIGQQKQLIPHLFGIIFKNVIAHPIGSDPKDNPIDIANSIVLYYRPHNTWRQRHSRILYLVSQLHPHPVQLLFANIGRQFHRNYRQPLT
ncbi:hypothetical protein SDC9_87646 [bioreactor metagenome]|uniref:Uncharacterized protein n=1 Tax=bioreactor metagenome TaxID=1076179 RepID=A0A644ZJU0_9ZZZZ